MRTCEYYVVSQTAAEHVVAVATIYNHSRAHVIAIRMHVRVSSTDRHPGISTTVR